MLPSRSGSAFSLERHIPNIERVCAVVLAIGLAWSVIAFASGLETSATEVVFPVAAFVGAALLFWRGCIYSSVQLAFCAGALAAATGIASDSWLTNINFEEDLLVEPLRSRGHHAIGAFVAMLYLMVFRTPAPPTSAASTPAERSFARSVWWGALLLAIPVQAFNSQGPLITEASYGTEAWVQAGGGGKQDVGLQVIGFMLMAISIAAAMQAFGRKSAQLKVAVFTTAACLLYFHFLRGTRSATFGTIVVAVSFYFRFSRTHLRVPIALGSLLLALLLARGWEVVRSRAASAGLAGAIQEAHESIEYDLTHEKGPDEADRFTDAYWYMLNVMQLYEYGIRRNGETYANLIPQAIPDAVAKILDFERPPSEPWVFAAYVTHGGGIFIPAEAYWNFGLSGVVGLGVLIGLLFRGIEKFQRLSPILRSTYYSLVIINVGGMTVGIQGIVRAVEIALLVAGTLSLMLTVHRARYAPSSEHRLAAGPNWMPPSLR